MRTMVRMVAMLAGVLCAAGGGAAVSAQSPMGATEAARPQAAASMVLTVTVHGVPTVFSVADLKTLPQKTVKVHNEHTKADETYTGVALSDVLAKAGFTASKATQREMLRSYLHAEGTDQYWVVYAVTEVESSEHEGDVLVALGMNGGDLGADGKIKLISTEDKKPQRWVRNLTAITMTPAQ